MDFKINYTLETTGSGDFLPLLICSHFPSHNFPLLARPKLQKIFDSCLVSEENRVII